MITVKVITLPLPYKEIASLLQDAFAERLLQGLNFACATFDEEDFKAHLSKDACVIGAFDNEKIVGVVVLNNILSKKGIRYGTHEYLAVASSAKRKGIASLLLAELKSEARCQKIDFILSDTAVQATSSVLYHKKNKFKIYGISHYEGRLYDSYNFILPISIKGHVISSWIGRKVLKKFFTNK